MNSIISLVASSPSVKARHDDDGVGRLHNRYTTLTLVVFAVAVTAGQYIANPVYCWGPAHFTSSHLRFTNNFCWVQNNYFLPLEEEIPKEHESDSRNTILYYQWIPFIFLAQACMFYAPSIVWHGLNSKAGIDADNILESAATFDKTEKLENKDKLLNLVTNQLDRFLSNRKKKNEWSFSLQHILRSTFCRLCGRRMGNYLFILFMFVKLLYILNAFGQLFILNAILKTNYNIYGVEAIENALEDRAWINSTVFPKVTMCDFHVRRLGNVQRYTVQCLLPANLYVEKMFIYLWFWLVLVLTISFVNLGMWLVRGLWPGDRMTYVRNHLYLGDRLTTERDRENVRHFVTNYLQMDGVFLLRLIGHNTNRITVTELVSSLWNKWKEDQGGFAPSKATPVRPTCSPPPPPSKPYSVPMRPLYSPPSTPSAPYPHSLQPALTPSSAPSSPYHNPGQFPFYPSVNIDNSMAKPPFH